VNGRRWIIGCAFSLAITNKTIFRRYGYFPGRDVANPKPPPAIPGLRPGISDFILRVTLLLRYLSKDVEVVRIGVGRGKIGAGGLRGYLQAVTGRHKGRGIHSEKGPKKKRESSFGLRPAAASRGCVP